MTTSGRARKPAGQRAAQADISPGISRPSDDRPETASQADAAPAAPGDPQELEREIERTREQLGETVELLAAKADVKRRAQATPVWEATPEPVRQAVAKGARTARQRQVPLVAAAAALIVGYLLIRW